jgi:predicted DNA binding CopG/RHH family protein
MKTAPKKTRVNMRIPEDLLKWAKRYAKKQKSCVTKLFVEYLDTLKTNAKVMPP